MKFDIHLVVCRDGKEFAKNWSTLTLRVKTRAEWDRQISKFDITSTDIYRDILHTQNEISSQICVQNI